MKKPNSLSLFIQFFLHCFQSFSNVSPPTFFKTLGVLLILLLASSQCYGFDLNNLMDDVGNAVKSGVNTIEEGVKQILPGDEPQKQNPQQAAPQNQPAKATTKTTQKKAFATDESQEETAPVKVTKKAESKNVTKAAAPAKLDTGGSVFSNQPINPETPPAPMSSFSAGDRIYGMLKAAKPWKQLLGSSDYLIMYVYIDGKEKTHQMVGLKRPDLLQLDYFIIDIAPAPENMSNYSDRDIVFSEKEGYKFGPELFTRYISELSPGDHTFRLEVKAYNKVFAAGEFTVSGADFSGYSELLAEIKEGAGKQQKMPKPGMTDLNLQSEMVGLLKNAGWPDIRRLFIVDKDWWIDRIAGGDSAVKSRHIEAAAAARETDGSYYYCHVTFHQPMLITGNWGKLELTHTGNKKPIPEANIDN